MQKETLKFRIPKTWIQIDQKTISGAFDTVQEAGMQEVWTSSGSKMFHTARTSIESIPST
jgi:hypothetical protein